MEDRLEIWLELLAGKLDRLIELGENVERASRSQEMPEEWGEHEGDHFAGADKMVPEGPSTEAVRSDSLGDGYRIPSEGDIGKVVEVRHAMGESWVQRKLVKVLSDSVPGCAALRHCQFLCSLDQSQTMVTCWRWARIKIDEPAKEPEHPAGPMPDPGEGYRILGKNPPEELAEGDEFLHPGLGRWAQSIKSMCGGKKQDVDCWYRRKIGFPAKEPKPAWEPKAGDWVLVTRPENWRECRNPDWSTAMHQYHGKVMQVSCYEKRWGAWVANFYGVDWFFHRDWLSPAEAPAIDKPPEPEYREPVLPADLGKWAEFSHDGINWIRYKLCGCYKESESSLTIWSEKNIGFRYCRIRKWS